MIEHEVDSMALAIDYAANLALGEEKLTNAELARLLHHRLDDQERVQTARKRTLTVVLP
jgi:hypothetical protein